MIDAIAELAEDVRLGRPFDNVRFRLEPTHVRQRARLTVTITTQTENDPEPVEMALRSEIDLYALQGRPELLPKMIWDTLARLVLAELRTAFDLTPLARLA